MANRKKTVVSKKAPPSASNPRASAGQSENSSATKSKKEKTTRSPRSSTTRRNSGKRPPDDTPENEAESLDDIVCDISLIPSVPSDGEMEAFLRLEATVGDSDAKGKPGRRRRNQAPDVGSVFRKLRMRAVKARGSKSSDDESGKFLSALDELSAVAQGDADFENRWQGTCCVSAAKRGRARTSNRRMPVRVHEWTMGSSVVLTVKLLADASTSTLLQVIQDASDGAVCSIESIWNAANAAESDDVKVWFNESSESSIVVNIGPSQLQFESIIDAFQAGVTLDDGQTIESWDMKENPLAQPLLAGRRWSWSEFEWKATGFDPLPDPELSLLPFVIQALAARREAESMLPKTATGRVRTRSTR